MLSRRHALTLLAAAGAAPALASCGPNSAKPPAVTPSSGVGFPDEYNRLAEETLEILTGMQLKT